MRVISFTPCFASRSASATTDSKRRRAELAAQLRDDAERAGMIAAFGDLDIGGVFRRCQQTRRVLVVEIVGQIGDGAIPFVAGETSGFFTRRAFWSIGYTGLELLACTGGVEDHERRRVIGLLGLNAAGGKDGFQFAGADDGIDFRNVLLDLVAIALHEASGDDQLLGPSRRPCERPFRGWCRPTPAWRYR